MATAQEKAAQGVVVGMAALTGQSQAVPRYDIDVLLYNYPDTFNLFLQAIAIMQKNKDATGFFGLAGIHGLPTALWDGVDKVFRDTYGGYCAHGVLTFPTWHRPYLALFEQSIYLKMVEVANGYEAPHKQRYLDAAKQFRLPYLDYFRPRAGKVSFPGMGDNGETTSFDYDFRLPDIFNEQNVTIKYAPKDEARSGPNPLYQFNFTSANGQLSAPDQAVLTRNGDNFVTSRTVRWPANSRSTTHDLNKLSFSLNSGREGRAQFLLELLNSTPYGGLRTVASDKALAKGDMTVADTEVQGRGSLEGTLHGAYHNLIGGFATNIAGQMTHPGVAAFDPVFWFHHCNIDRIWALWQVMHPKSWFPVPGPGQTADNLKDLLPFYDSRTGPGKGTYFNSDKSRTTEAFGYIYDDFVDNKTKDRTTLWNFLQTKYTWATRTPDDSSFRSPPSTMVPLNVRSRQFFQPPSGTSARTTTSFMMADAASESEPTLTSSIAATVEPITSQAQAVLSGISNTVSSAFVPQRISAKFDREWYVDCTVKRAAANGPFTVYFFVAKPGQVTTDPAEYMFSPYLAGFTYIFASSREACDNCGDIAAAGQLLSDTTNITAILLDYMKRSGSGLTSLKPDQVRPFLIANLRWRVVYQATNAQDPRRVPDLSLEISAKISHDDGSKTYETYSDIIPEIIRNASASSGS